MVEVGGDSKGETTPLPRGPFNGTIKSDSVLISEGINRGKAYRVTVMFYTEVHREGMEIFKDICKYILVKVVRNVSRLIISLVRNCPVHYLIIDAV